MIYKVLFGLIICLSLASSPTALCLISFTPNILALFQALVLAVLLATTGPLHMLFSPPRIIFSFTQLTPTHLSHLSSMITSSRIPFLTYLIKLDSTLEALITQCTSPLLHLPHAVLHLQIVSVFPNII